MELSILITITFQSSKRSVHSLTDTVSLTVFILSFEIIEVICLLLET